MELVHGTMLNRWLKERGPLALDQFVPFGSENQPLPGSGWLLDGRGLEHAVPLLGDPYVHHPCAASVPNAPCARRL
jgi:hypothetical protein